AGEEATRDELVVVGVDLFARGAVAEAEAGNLCGRGRRHRCLRVVIAAAAGVISALCAPLPARCGGVVVLRGGVPPQPEPAAEAFPHLAEEGLASAVLRRRRWLLLQLRRL